MNLTKIEVLNPEAETCYPYSSKLFQGGFSIELGEITILVGENGVGKSTLLEAIAQKIGFPLTGGTINHQSVYNDLSAILNYHKSMSTKTLVESLESKDFFDESIDDLSLSDNLRLTWKNRNRKGMFLRSEAFATMINLPKFSTANNLSHGEGIIQVVGEIQDDGVYILDEPEAGLSPIKTIELMSKILYQVRANRAQFIISTHSPILMLIPNSIIFNITHDEISRVSPEETQHFKITKQILNNSKDFINKYFSDMNGN